MAPLPYPARPLTDGVVVLRPREDADAEAFAGLGADPDVARYIDGIGPDDDAEQARAFGAERERRRVEGGVLPLIVADAGDGAVLGDCELHTDETDPRACRLGYLLLPSARGRGYATRAVRLLASYAREALEMTRIEALVDPANEASARVLERAGFTRGELVRDARGPGEDRVVFSASSASPGP